MGPDRPAGDGRGLFYRLSGDVIPTPEVEVAGDAHAPAEDTLSLSVRRILVADVPDHGPQLQVSPPPLAAEARHDVGKRTAWAGNARRQLRARGLDREREI